MEWPSQSRRSMLRSFAALAAYLAAPVRADDSKVVRIGYQKGGGLLSLLKARSTLDDKLRPAKATVTWSEFPAGPQLLEAMNAGSLDFGYVGAPPPIFAQAAGNDLVYVGAEPVGLGTEAIVSRRASKLDHVAALKGRRVAVQKNSSAYYLLLASLEKAGLTLNDVEAVNLAPAYARAAFEADRVDAWAIWDPYLASAQASSDLQVIADYGSVPETYSFYVATRSFADHSAAELSLILRELAEVGAWVNSDPGAAARVLAPQLNLPLSIVELWQRRTHYGERPIDTAVIASQQRVADAFLRFRLIPKRIEVVAAALGHTV